MLVLYWLVSMLYHYYTEILSTQNLTSMQTFSFHLYKIPKPYIEDERNWKQDVWSRKCGALGALFALGNFLPFLISLQLKVRGDWYSTIISMVLGLVLFCSPPVWILYMTWWGLNSERLSLVTVSFGPLEWNQTAILINHNKKPKTACR